MASLNFLFPPGAFPEYRLDCTGGGCTAVKANCTNSFVEFGEAFMEFGVICKNYEDIYNESTTVSNKLPEAISQSPTIQQGIVS